MLDQKDLDVLKSMMESVTLASEERITERMEGRLAQTETYLLLLNMINELTKRVEELEKRIA